MIRVNDGAVAINGKKDDLFFDLVCMLRSLRDEGVFEKKDFEEALRLSTLSSEELKEEANRAFKETMKAIAEDEELQAEFLRFMLGLK